MSDEELRKLAERLDQCVEQADPPYMEDVEAAASAILSLMDRATIAEEALRSSRLDCLSLETRLVELEAERDEARASALNHECRFEAASARGAAAEARLGRALEALREIRDDDKRPSHPCGPQEYGYYGNIARSVLSDLEPSLPQEPRQEPASLSTEKAG